MPIKKSAQKHLRQSLKKTVLNQTVKSNIRKLEKILAKEITAQKKNEARETFHKLTQAADKAAKNNVLTAAAAGRIKSRFQKAVDKIA